MSEEKKTHPEHKYSVTFVSKVGTISIRFKNYFDMLLNLNLTSVPDYINSSTVQVGYEGRTIFFHGISGVVNGSFSLIYYSLSSVDEKCTETTGSFTDLSVRQNIVNVVMACVYQLSIAAQCGNMSGPSTNFTIVMPGK